MTFRSRPGLLLSLFFGLVPLLQAGCDQRAFVVLELQDPDGLALEAVAISYGAGPDGFARVELEGEGFPLSQTLVGADGEERDLWVDALSGDDTVLARAAVSVIFDIDRTGAATAVFGLPCEADSGCDDGTYCNGAETCSSRVCVGGEAPCPASAIACITVSCNEAAEACELSPDHGQCDPLPIPGTQLTEPTYCDARLGCVPGEGCDLEGDPCPRNALCEWNRTCISGRCVPTAPLDVDDQNPCTVDYCELGTGEVHAPDPFANGNTCPIGGGSLGICLQGACVGSSCGDGFLDLSNLEECDTGDDRSDTSPNACRMDCTLPICGDGVADSGEPCDDGNAIEEDACRSGCILNVCGDGVVNQAAEDCDDGNADDTDDCVSGCFAAGCGDGFVWSGQEECDDGNASQLDPCLNDCSDNVCGDGHHDLLNEECDDGNTDDTDACVTGCLDALCGDGFVESGVEECDDANGVSTDDCLITCEDNTCGDGIQNIGVEACEDGNNVSHDGCAADCDYIIWQTDLGAPIGDSALVSWMTPPIPMTHTLGIGTTDGVFHALNSSDGSTAWSYTASAPIQATATSVNHRIVVLSTDGRLHGFLKTGPDAGGNPEWTFDLPTTSSSIGLIREQGGVVVVDDQGTLSSVGSDGVGRALGYSYALASNLGTCAGCVPSSASSGAVVSQGIMVGLGETVVGANFSSGCPPSLLNLQPGETLRGEIAWLGDNSTDINDRDKGWMVTSFNRVIQAHFSTAMPVNCASDAVLEDWSWASGTSSLVSPVVMGGLWQGTGPDPRAILFGGADGLLHRINVADMPGGGPVWSYDLGSALSAPVAHAVGHIYAGGADGRIHKVQQAAGALAWVVQGPGPLSGSPLLANEMVLVSTRNGFVVALERGAHMEDASMRWHRQRADNQGTGFSTGCSSANDRQRQTALGMFFGFLFFLAWRSRR